MRIVFVNRFYWPDEQATAQLLTDLAESLASRGWQVEVLCSMPSGKEAPREEVRRGVTIRRLGSPSGKTVSLVRRSLAFADFLAGSCWQAFRLLRPGDLLVTLTDPPMLGTSLWPLAKLRGAKQLHWVQDIYPEVAITLFESGAAKTLFRLLLPFRNFALRHSAGCVTLGDDMAGLLVRSEVPRASIALIPNWAPDGIRPLPEDERAKAKTRLGLGDKFVVLYSGNLGRVHEIDVLWQVAAALQNNPDIVFLVVGGGAGRRQLEEAVRREALGNVRFLPPQARERLSESLGAGDVHLITLKASCAATVYPSKFYGIAAAGRPMVFVGPQGCELASLVERHGMGRAFEPAQVPAFAAHLAALAADPVLCRAQGVNARSFAESQGLRAHAVERWQRLLETLSPQSSP